MPLHPSFRHVRSSHYGRPGGPWDVSDLDSLLSAVPVTVVDADRRLADREADAEVNRVAQRLAGAGIGPRRVVAWQAPNSIEGWALYRACWRLGAVAAPLHHGAGSADVAAALDQVVPDLLLSAPSMPAAERQPAVDLAAFLAAGARPDQPDGPDAPVAPAVVDPASLAVVLFTAGSTGRPKAVLHTHRGLAAKARTMVAVHGLGPADAVLMPAPLAHISGLLNGLLVPGVAGMKTVFMARWDPAAAVGLIEAEEVTFMIGPPTFFISLMDAPGFSRERVSSLRLVSSGGAGVTPAFVASAAATLGCRVKRTYGSTEAPTITTSGPSDAEDRAAETDGRPTGEAEVQIVAPSSGLVAAVGVVGEVWLRGPEVCEGYVDAEQTSAAFTADGWFRTGDLGRLDGDGWLVITGRMKDVIIRGGENISAAELEAVLERHPSVRQAVVVGFPDERLGQRVCAFVVATTPFGIDDCRVWMEASGVTRFKWPERVVRAEELPLLGAGKVDRAALERRAEGLG